MQQSNLKEVSRRLWFEVLAATIVAALGGELPQHRAARNAWKFVATHPVSLLHVVIGTVVLIEALVFTYHALRSKDYMWTIIALGGLASVLCAYGAGEAYVMSQGKTALTVMGNSAGVALVAYGWGWFWGHRKSRNAPR